jgi:hypothetical protein
VAGFRFAERTSEEKGKEVKEIMKRILMVLTVALLMVALIAANAAPAFADSGKNGAGFKIGNKSTNPNDGNGAVKKGNFPGRG